MSGFKNTNLASLFAERAAIEDSLAAARAEFEATLSAKKERASEISASINEIAVPLAQAAYAKADKHDGTVKFASGDAIFKSEIKKTVSYDSDALMAVASSIAWDEAKNIFKFKCDISETVFKKLEDEALKARIVAARTVKYGEPRVTLAD